jgi:hypothetical protein
MRTLQMSQRQALGAGVAREDRGGHDVDELILKRSASVIASVRSAFRRTPVQTVEQIASGIANRHEGSGG